MLWCICGNWHDQHTSEISLPWIKHYFLETRKHVLFSAYQVSINVYSSHNTETLLSLTHDSQPLRYTDIKNGRDFLKICCNQFMLTNSYQKLDHTTKCFRRKVFTFQMASSFPEDGFLLTHPPPSPHPLNLSSSGRFFIQLLSCKKVLFLCTSWKPCCFSVVPWVELFISVNRKNEKLGDVINKELRVGC